MLYLYFFLILFCSVVQGSSGPTSTISPYKIIPPCSLCKFTESTVLKPEAETDSFTELLYLTRNMNSHQTLPTNESNNQDQNDQEEETDENVKNPEKWKLDKKQYPRKLRINYKDFFDVYFKRLSIIEKVSNEQKLWPEIKITPKLMTLYLYTPSAKGLSRKDFKVAYELSKAMSEKPIHSDYSKGISVKSTRLTIDQTLFLLFHNAPNWNFTFLGGRSLSRLFNFKTFSETINFIQNIKLFPELEFQLNSIYLTEKTALITLKQQISKTVHQETVDFAIKIDKLHSLSKSE